MTKDEEKLGKIIELAKRGEGGEKEIAIKLVKKMCKKLGLNYDDVMSKRKHKEEFHIDIKRGDFKLTLQIIVRYAYDGDSTQESISGSYDRSRVYFKTTQDKYLEVVNAYEVLSRMYKLEERKAKEALYYGFLEKHNLYANHVKDKEDEDDEDEMKARLMGSLMSRGMDDAQIRKALTEGKK